MRAMSDVLSTLAHDPAKWIMRVSTIQRATRLREARFGGRSQVGRKAGIHFC
jgi:hypothetical protein